MSEEVLRPPGRGDVMSEVCRNLLISAVPCLINRLVQLDCPGGTGAEDVMSEVCRDLLGSAACRKSRV